MSATLTTLGSLLKTIYEQKIAEQLPNHNLILELSTDQKYPFDGEKIRMAAHVGRNSSVAAGSIPGAVGEQKFVHWDLGTKDVFGRWKVDGKAIRSTKSEAGRIGAAGALEIESDGLERDLKRTVNRWAVSGNEVIGFLCERKASSLATAPQVNDGTGVAEDTWQFDGDGTRLAAVVNGTETTYVRIKLVRMDTYEDVTLVAGPTNPNFFISQYTQSAAGDSVKIAFGADNGSGSEGFTTADVDPDYAIAVVLHPTQAVDNAAANFGAAPGNFAEEIHGIFTNLASQSHPANPASGLSNVARKDSDGDNAALQSTIFTVKTTAAGGRDDLTLDRLDEVFSEGYSRAERYADLMLSHPKQIHALGRAQFAAGMQFNLQGNMPQERDGGVKLKSALGETGYGHSGVPLKQNLHVPRGMYIGFTKDTWHRSQLEDGKFADEDGQTVRKSSNTEDAYEALYVWHLDWATDEPRANWIICGMNYR